VGNGNAWPPRRTLPPAIADGLRVARHAQRLSFRAAAERVGILPGYLCLIEQGKRCPSVAVAEDLIAGLRLDPELAEQLRAVAVPDKGRSGSGRASERAAARPRDWRWTDGR
jgi:transcriptional regulator with XRE-family HTH domain